MKKFFLGFVLFLVGIFLFSSDSEKSGPFAQTKNGKIWAELTSSEKNAKSNPGIDINALNKVTIDLNKNLSPAVVNIYTKTRVVSQKPRFHQGGPADTDDLFRYFFGNPFGGGGGGGGDFFSQVPREAQSLGSGFVVGADGHIITNSHVVRMGGKNADSIMIKFLDDPRNSKGHEAIVLGVDESTDVALLKLKEKPKKNLIFAPLGDSEKLQVGEWVVAIGNPYGHQNSFTQGLVSALGRDLEQSRAEFIQTSASINPGNSGGPLINLFGEVIGINTAIDARAQGIGFAIPINIAKNVITQIIEKGEVVLGWIGVGMSELTPDIAKSMKLKSETQGILVQEVFPGEPADKAGIRSYDIVTAVNGKNVSTPRELSLIVGNQPVGTQVNFKILRDSKTMDLKVTVAKRPTNEEVAGRGSGEGRRGRGEAPDLSGKKAKNVGVEITDLTPEFRRRLNLDASTQGALIIDVDRRSPAASAGLQPGDLIVEVDRRPVKNSAEAQNILKKVKDSFLLKVQRATMSMIVVVDLNAADESEDE